MRTGWACQAVSRDQGRGCGGRAGKVLKGIGGVCAQVSGLEAAGSGAAFSQGVPE